MVMVAKCGDLEPVFCGGIQEGHPRSADDIFAIDGEIDVFQVFQPSF
jgi:hypothetical protein